tara:strand:- start:113 stop:421 length:309 start_codon:yes stop_codon:yes gene_type:complete
MKDKRTYINQKEHGEDMTHENESKIDTTPIESLTEQYRTELHKYRVREGLYLQTENQLKGTKQIVLQMASTIRELKTKNETLQAEISRLREEIQLLEMQIKK